MMKSVAASVAGAAAVAGAAWAVRGRASAVFAPSIWRGPRARRALALTFDDGPSESTPALLELLARDNVPATFFQCGANIDRLPHIARAAFDAGHEIGNHTDSHPMFCFRSPAFMRRELDRVQRAVEANTGARPTL